MFNSFLWGILKDVIVWGIHVTIEKKIFFNYNARLVRVYSDVNSAFFYCFKSIRLSARLIIGVINP